MLLTVGLVILGPYITINWKRKVDNYVYDIFDSDFISVLERHEELQDDEL
ncbi:MAG: hypothetical protein BAJATHORv1_30045 [Candidatus Thorarchaeota archaeon]|nr:MAG: hypothetical protein BAJATHORv1_30045 [Candidatus Thorarchaeota archaeon]